MTEILRISGKQLGELALPDCCERDVWFKLHMGFRLPFQFFPGIFSSIDAYTKNMVHLCLDRSPPLPSWLANLAPLSGYQPPPHYSRFNTTIESHGILLTGAPDGLLARADGTLVIVDYKTAKFTATQDALFPLYKVQLNAYALIAERCGFGRVSGLALVYFEPMTQEICEKRCQGYGFDLGFAAHVLPVTLNLSEIDPLLERARAVYERRTPPAGRPGCANCALLDRLWMLGKRADLSPISTVNTG